MAVEVTYFQSRFNVGTVGFGMQNRSDLDAYKSAIEYARNCYCMPQGPIVRRRGFAFNSVFQTFDDESNYFLKKFRISKRQEYLLVFRTDGNIYIHDNAGIQVAVKAHGYQAEHIRSCRFVQSGNTLIIANSTGRYMTKQLRNNGSPTEWGIADIAISKYAYQAYHAGLEVTPSAATGTNITLTISGSLGYWNAGHCQNVRIKFNSGYATIKSLSQSATGGTAIAGAGTAANAFDNNTGTHCDAGINGWIGYRFSGATTVRVVGLNAEVTVNADLVFEAADNNTFTTGLVECGVASGTLTAGTLTWINVPNYTAKQHFRVRVENGVQFDLKEMVLRRGLVAIADVTTSLGSTAARTDWREQMLGPHAGYPRSVTFKDDRLIFGGIGGLIDHLRLGDPRMVIARKTSDYFNFDDTAATTNFSWRAFVHGDGNDEIMNIAYSRSGLAVFTSEAEFIIQPKGTTAMGPDNPPLVERQTTDGSADVPSDGIHGGLIFISRDGKQIKVFDYEFAIDSFTSNPLTLYAHTLFTNQITPRRLCVLRNYDVTNGTMIFAPTSEGTLLCCRYDSKRTPAWTEWDIENGEILDCEVIEYAAPGATTTRPTLFVLARVNMNGESKLVLGRWDDQENVYLDFYFKYAPEDPTTTVPPQAALAAVYGESEVRAIIDGTVDTTYEVQADGRFELNRPASVLFVGQQYQTFIRSLPIPVELYYDGQLKGNPVFYVKMHVDVDNSMDLWLNGDQVLFREFGPNLLNQPLVGVTRTVPHDPADISDDSSRCYWEAWVTEPVPLTIKAVTRKVSCTK